MAVCRSGRGQIKTRGWNAFRQPRVIARGGALRYPLPVTLTCVRRQRVSKEFKMVTLTFPDGARRDYPNGTTGLEIAKGISPSLAKRTVAMALDGTVVDLADAIERDARI